MGAKFSHLINRRRHLIILYLGKKKSKPRSGIYTFNLFLAIGQWQNVPGRHLPKFDGFWAVGQSLVLPLDQLEAINDLEDLYKQYWILQLLFFLPSLLGWLKAKLDMCSKIESLNFSFGLSIFSFFFFKAALRTPCLIGIAMLVSRCLFQCGKYKENIKRSDHISCILSILALKHLDPERKPCVRMSSMDNFLLSLRTMQGSK